MPCLAARGTVKTGILCNTRRIDIGRMRQVNVKWFAFPSPARVDWRNRQYVLAVGSVFQSRFMGRSQHYRLSSCYRPRKERSQLGFLPREAFALVLNEHQIQ